MKTLYFVMGLFVGLLIASRYGKAAYEVQAANFDKEFQAAILTGYSEGWARGRDYTEGRLSRLIFSCQAETCHLVGNCK